MSELKATVAEQLLELPLLMHRSFHTFGGGGRGRNPHGGGRVHNPHRGQGRVLAILSMKPEISQKELTFLLGMSKQSLAELLSKLEKSGYITREPSEDDRRVLIVRLTEKGREAAPDADDEASETTYALDCLSDAELAALSDYLARIISRYEEQFPDEDFDKRRRMMAAFITHHDGRFRDRGFGKRDGGLRPS